VPFAFLTAVSYAADQIALTCSGTRVVEGTKELASNLSLIIDLKRGIVTVGSIGDLSIVKRTETSIHFNGNSKDGQTVWRGDVDRFSGVAVVSAFRNKGVVMHYQLTCRLPEPLF
jgi:hypothetical protein